MHTAFSIALSIPSSRQREMENSVFMHRLSKDPSVKTELQKMKEIDQLENRDEKDTC